MGQGQARPTHGSTEFLPTGSITSDPRTGLALVAAAPPAGAGAADPFALTRGCALHWLGPIEKYNHKWKADPRVLFVSDECVYIAGAAGDVRRCTLISAMRELVVCGRAIGFRFELDFDMSDPTPVPLGTSNGHGAGNGNGVDGPAAPPEPLPHDMLLVFPDERDAATVVRVLSAVYRRVAGPRVDPLSIRNLRGADGVETLRVQGGLNLFKPRGWLVVVRPLTPLSAVAASASPKGQAASSTSPKNASGTPVATSANARGMYGPGVLQGTASSNANVFQNQSRALVLT